MFNLGYDIKVYLFLLIIINIWRVVVCIENKIIGLFL